MYRRTLILKNDTMWLKCHYHDREIAKSIPGYRYLKQHQAWEYPLLPDTLSQLQVVFPNLEVDPPVFVAVESIKQQRDAVTQAKDAGWENAEPIKPMPIKVKPFRHQILGYNIMLSLPHSALLMEQGCGKTLTTVAAAGRWFLDGEIERVLVVAPSSVVSVWPTEFSLYADFPVDVLVLDHSSVAKRIDALSSWEENREALQVAVINYEAVWRMEEELSGWKPDLVVADESQRIKTPGSKQSKAMHRLGRKAKRRVILTGTPVTQGPLDFFSMYKFLDPRIFGNNFYSFKSRYAILVRRDSFTQVVGYQNIDELVRKAHSIAFRVTKDEALDLPEIMDQNLYCNMEPKAMQLYWQMAQDSVMELENGKVTARNILTQLLRLSQLTGGFAGDFYTEGIKQVSNAKFKLLAEVVDDLYSAGKKVVIFARFRPEIALIENFLAEKGEYAVVHGDVPKDERGLEVKRFQEDPNCMGFLAQLQTAGLGLTLHAASTAIFYSLDFSYANYGQCKARIHRIGQHHPCTYVHLLAKGTIDTKVMRILNRKKSVADDIVDNWKSYFFKEND